MSSNGDERTETAEELLSNAAEYATEGDYFEAYELAREAVEELEDFLEEQDALREHMTGDR